jgi:integrase
MKYVNRSVDRTGKVRLYFRKKNHPQDGKLLSNPEGSAALQAEVDALLGLQPNPPKGDNLAQAIQVYRTTKLTKLRGSTRYDYEVRLHEFEDDMGALQMAHVCTAPFCLELQLAWEERGHRAASINRQVMRNVMKLWLAANDKPNPWENIDGARRPSDAVEAHPIWPEWVVTTAIEKAIADNKPGLARAIALGRWAGARRGDLIRLRPENRKDGMLDWLSGKHRIPVCMPEDPKLTAWLERIPERRPLSPWQRWHDRTNGVVRMAPPTLVFTQEDKPYRTEAGLGHAVKALVLELHGAGKIDKPDYDLHGLRHSFAVEGALAGWDELRGMAMMGHKGPETFRVYIKQASRLKMQRDAAAQVQKAREAEVQNKVQKSAKQG